MRQKLFYRLDGSRALVTIDEWHKRTRRQEQRAKKRGERIYRPKRNSTPSSLSPDEYREKIKQATRSAIVYRRTKEARKKTREYPGPSADIVTTQDVGQYIAALVEWSNLIAIYDGRQNLVITLNLDFDITMPDGDTFTIDRTNIPILFVRGHVRSGSFAAIDPDDFRAVIMQTLHAQGVGSIPSQYKRKNTYEQEMSIGDIAQVQELEQEGEALEDTGIRANISSTFIVRTA